MVVTGRKNWLAQVLLIFLGLSDLSCLIKPREVRAGLRSRERRTREQRSWQRFEERNNVPFLFIVRHNDYYLKELLTIMPHTHTHICMTCMHRNYGSVGLTAFTQLMKASLIRPHSSWMWPHFTLYMSTLLLALATRPLVTLGPH